MNNFIKTMDNCREYILTNPNAALTFQNTDRSNCAGFEYTLRSGISIRLRVDEDISYLILDAFPGITANAGCQSLVTEYCQRMSRFPCAVYLTMEPERGNIYCHCETSFRSNPVSVSLLARMESMVLDLLNKHVPVLECLAYGKLPSWENILAAQEHSLENANCPVPSDAQMMLNVNLQNLQDYLGFYGHHTVSEIMKSDEPVPFYAETICNGIRYREFLCLRNGFLVWAVRPDIRCAEAYRSQAAQLCNKISDKIRIGFLTIGDDGYPYASVSSYLMEGPEFLDSNALEKMEHVAFVILQIHAEQLACVCSGSLPSGIEKGVDSKLSANLLSAINRFLNRGQEEPDES